MKELWGESTTAADEAAAVCTDQSLTWKHYSTGAGQVQENFLGEVSQFPIMRFIGSGWSPPQKIPLDPVP